MSMLPLSWTRLPVPVGARPPPGRDAGTGDATSQEPLGWQRALAQAQQPDVSKWFAAVPQTSGPSPPAAASWKRTSFASTDRGLIGMVPRRTDGYAIANAHTLARMRENDRESAVNPSDPTGPGSSSTLTAGAQAAMPAEHSLLTLRASGQTVSSLDRAVFEALMTGTTPSLVDESTAGRHPLSPSEVSAHANTPTVDSEELRSAESEESSPPAPAPGPGTSGTTPSSVDDPNALSVHAEWSTEGVRLWLGMGSGMSLPVDAIARHLRRLVQAHGEQLLGVIVNGRAVWIRPDGSRIDGLALPSAPDATHFVSSPSSSPTHLQEFP